MKTIIHTTDIATTREAAFEALTTVPGLSAWWTTKVTGHGGPEGRLSFTFAGDFNPVMKVIGFTAPARLEWECVDGAGQWRGNTFRFELEERGSGSRLRFRQEYAAELSDDDYGSYNYNWGYYLESLRQYLETGTGRPFSLTAASPAVP
jgi:uncharacterized protein YndB with AHSA1/START domain